MSDYKITEDVFSKIKEIVYGILENEKLLQGEWHLGKINSVISAYELSVFIDGSPTPQTVPCNPNVRFLDNEEVFVIFINGDSKNKFVIAKRATGNESTDNGVGGGTNSGDMLKSTYDPDGDGKVIAAINADFATNSDKVDGRDVNDSINTTNNLWTASKISSELAQKANLSHTHTKSTITDFSESDYVHSTGSETISGIKTFSSIPILPAISPTNDNEAVRKKYVDDGLATKASASHTHTTSNITEGTNLYFTDERAQDAVGSILTDTSSIDLTYDDANNKIKADVKVDGNTIVVDTTNNYIKVKDGAFLNKLPIASSTTLGGVKIGENLFINADGVLNAEIDTISSNYVIKEEKFIATEGQTVFNLTQGTYVPNKNMIQAYVWGNRLPNKSFQETSETSITLNSSLNNGDEVTIVYTQAFTGSPFPQHGNEHLTGGSDPIPVAVANLNDGLMGKVDKAKSDAITLGAQGELSIDSKFGIGTASPQYKQDIVSGGTALRLRNHSTTTNSQVELRFSNTTANDASGAFSSYIAGVRTNTPTTGAQALIFGTSASSSAPTEKMRLDPNGNLGIGTSSPSAKLDVVGDIKSNGQNVVLDNDTRLHVHSNQSVLDKITQSGTETSFDLSAINNKQDIITGAASTITTSNLTASRVLVSNSSGKVAASTITTTQLGYLSGATSNIQTQIGTLNSLTTTDKTNLVAAINEVKSSITASGGGYVADTNAPSNTTLLWIDLST